MTLGYFVSPLFPIPNHYKKQKNIFTDMKMLFVFFFFFQHDPNMQGLHITTQQLPSMFLWKHKKTHKELLVSNTSNTT